MRFFSARLNFDNGIVLKFDGFVVNLFQYKTAHEGLAEGLKDFYEDKTRSLVQRMMTVLERLKATGQNCWPRQRQWQNGGRAKRDNPTSCRAGAWTCRSRIKRVRKKRECRGAACQAETS